MQPLFMAVIAPFAVNPARATEPAPVRTCSVLGATVTALNPRTLGRLSGSFPKTNRFDNQTFIVTRV